MTGADAEIEALYRRAMALRRVDRRGNAQKAAMRQAAVAGHPVAMYQLAVDSAAERRFEEVEYWLQRAVASGHRLAGQELARLQPEIERFRAEDQPHLDQARTEAERGEPGAALRYASLLRGLGRSEATTWYERAAQSGDPTAILEWGDELNRTGRIQEAFGWFERAADRGDGRARDRLIAIFEAAGDHPGMVYWLRRGTEAGDLTSFRRLGVLLLRDGHRPQGLSWLEEASRRGDPASAAELAEIALIDGDEAAAQRQLDRCAGTGWGEIYQARVWERQGRIDDAARLYRNLAESADNTTAMLLLGLLLERRGDLDEARTWLEEASADPAYGSYAERCAARVQARAGGDPAVLERATAAAEDPALTKPVF